MKQQTLMSEGFRLIHDIFRLRWIPEIISAIGIGCHSYNEILCEIDGLSHTELNRKLKVLLERHVIEKREHATSSGYYLNPFGEDLNHIFNHFSEMSEKYL